MTKLRDRVFRVALAYKEGRASDADMYEIIDEALEQAQEEVMVRTIRKAVIRIFRDTSHAVI